MPDVTTEYRLLQPAGHHRQPRSHATSVLLTGGGTAPEIPGATGSRDAIEYSDKQFVFWSVSDGTTGLTTANPHVDYTVSTAAMRVTAWYLPVGGSGDPAPPGFLVDAFSVAAGDFVDDDFVTITSDPSLTAQANVAGFVPTERTQTGRAVDAIGPEGFEHWIGASSAAGQDATFTRGDRGFAIATFKRPEHRAIPNLGDLDIALVAGIILGGVKVDGGGIIIRPGGGADPVDPWGPLFVRLARAVALGRLGAGLRGATAKAVRQAAAVELKAAAEAITKQAGKQR